MTDGTHRPLAAALWMGGSIVAFTLMAVAGRSVAGVHDTFEIMAWRSAIGFVMVCTLAALTGRLAEVRLDRIGSHALRNIVHFTGQNLWFWALTLIPLAQLVAMEFTSPLWVILLSPLVLGERLTLARIVAAVTGFAGVLLVARPDLRHLEPGLLAAVGAALFFAITALLTKRLTRGESIVSILFWLTAMQFVFGLTAAGLDGKISLPTAATLPWLILIGACGVVAHLCLTTALSLAPASLVVPVDFVRLPVIMAVGMMLYSEAVDRLVVVGAAVIFVGLWINLRSETRRTVTGE